MSTKKCLNCETLVSDNYCPVCGQPTSVERYKLKSIFKHFFSRIFSIDFDFMRTFNALLKRPGNFIEDFLLGKRQHFISPLKYFFIVMALNMAVTFIINKPALEPVIIESTMNPFLLKQLVTISSHLVFVFLLLPFSLGLRWFAPPKFNWIEQVSILLYIVSQSILYFIIIQLIVSPFKWVFMGSSEWNVWLVIFILLYFWIFLKIYQKAPKKVFRFIGIFLFSLLMLIFIMFLIRILVVVLAT